MAVGIVEKDMEATIVGLGFRVGSRESIIRYMLESGEGNGKRYSSFRVQGLGLETTIGQSGL